jgi:hypothetical protein
MNGDFPIKIYSFSHISWIYLLNNIFLWLSKYKCVHTIYISYTVCVLRI